MAVHISEQEAQAYRNETALYGLNGGVTGGPTKKRYYTPDGRVMVAIPNMVTNNKGEQRDANYDRGWLERLPAELKPYCRYCDQWHDTPGEIEACGKQQKATLAKFERMARREIVKDKENLELAGQAKDKEIADLKNEMAEIKAMMKQLLEKQNG